MRRVTPKNSLQKTGALVSARLRKHGVKLTLGGEPTFVPNDPVGPEWSITAVGPTKLNYAYALANGTLIKNSLPEAVPFFSPGKSYPGEVNPRWTIHLLWNRDGSPLTKTKMKTSRRHRRAEGVESQPPEKSPSVEGPLGSARSMPPAPKRALWILPLDHNGKKWTSESWAPTFGKSLTLTTAEGPRRPSPPALRASRRIQQARPLAGIQAGRAAHFLSAAPAKTFPAIAGIPLEKPCRGGHRQILFRGLHPLRRDRRMVEGFHHR